MLFILLSVVVALWFVLGVWVRRRLELDQFYLWCQCAIALLLVWAAYLGWLVGAGYAN